jgi:hypothetical protein
MTHKEQRRFIRELIKNVREEILLKAKDIPKEWDGIELRWLIADHFLKSSMRSTKSRKRNYNNEVIIKNLI